MNNQFMEAEYEEEYEETYDDYETMYANAPDTTVMIYDQRAVTALPDLLKNPEHTMPCGGLTLKQYQRGGETVVVAFEEGKQANVTGYTVLKKDLHLLDALYPEPQFTVWMWIIRSTDCGQKGVFIWEIRPIGNNKYEKII